MMHKVGVRSSKVTVADCRNDHTLLPSSLRSPQLHPMVVSPTPRARSHDLLWPMNIIKYEASQGLPFLCASCSL